MSTESATADRSVKLPPKLSGSVSTLIAGVAFFGLLAALATGYVAGGFASSSTGPNGSDSLQGSHLIATHYPPAVVNPTTLVLVFPSSVWNNLGPVQSAEQGLTSCEDGLIITAGNTTSQTGLLYEVTTKNRDQWEVVSITADPDDPKRTPRVDIDWAREQIALYGRENPWVMAYILGLFPPGSINALMSSDEVERAMNLHPRPETFTWAQKRLGIDVARFGDDRTVHFPRQGIVAFMPLVMRHPRDSAVSVDIASRAMAKRLEWMREGSTLEAENDDVLMFLDDTVGWAHGAVDVLRSAGLSPYAIGFDRPSTDPRYFNMRAQMWMEMANWIKAGGSLPPMPELIAELCSPTYFFHNGKFQIESKDQIKKRLGKSPDLADALALTFAIPDQPGGMLRLPGMNLSKQPKTYDPYASV